MPYDDRRDSTLTPGSLIANFHSGWYLSRVSIQFGISRSARRVRSWDGRHGVISDHEQVAGKCSLEVANCWKRYPRDTVTLFGVHLLRVNIIHGHFLDNLLWLIRHRSPRWLAKQDKYAKTYLVLRGLRETPLQAARTCHVIRRSLCG